METPPALNGRSRRTNWIFYVFAAQAGLIVLVVTVHIGVLLYGWWPHSPVNIPKFGATPTQFEKVYGPPVPGSFATPQTSPRSLWFETGGWYILVGFDEHDRAEQYVFSKANMPFSAPAAMTAAQQSRLLEEFKQSSAWELYKTDAVGSQWDRQDDQATAFYVDSSRWMIFMNQAGWDRLSRSLKLDGK